MGSSKKKLRKTKNPVGSYLSDFSKSPISFLLRRSSKKLSCRNKDLADISFFHHVFQIPILFGDVIIELLGIHREKLLQRVDVGHCPLRGRFGNIREHSHSVSRQGSVATIRGFSSGLNKCLPCEGREENPLWRTWFSV